MVEHGTPILNKRPNPTPLGYLIDLTLFLTLGFVSVCFDLFGGVPVTRCIVVIQIFISRLLDFVSEYSYRSGYVVLVNDILLCSIG